MKVDTTLHTIYTDELTFGRKKWPRAKMEERTINKHILLQKQIDNNWMFSQRPHYSFVIIHLVRNLFFQGQNCEICNN